MLPLTKLPLYIHNKKNNYQFRTTYRSFGSWTYNSQQCDILNDIRIGVRSIYLEDPNQVDEIMQFDGYLLYIYIRNKYYRTYDIHVLKLEKAKINIDDYIE